MWVSHSPRPLLHLPFSSAKPRQPPLCSLKSSSSPPSCSLSTPATASQNHMIQSLCKQGSLKQAFSILAHEPAPSQRTYEALIQACARFNAPSFGAVVHRRIIEDGLDQEPFLCTRLVEMYSQLNAIHDARQVFENARERSVFLWNAFLRALTLAGEGEEAIVVFGDMGRSGTGFDSFTYSYVLKACIGSSSDHSVAMRRVREIHGRVLRHGYESNVHVATTLVDVYAKLCEVCYARKLFDGMVDRNVVSWSAIIACYAKNERPFEALELFRSMMEKVDTVPNSVTMVSVLQACAGLSALEQGKVLHAYVLRRGLDAILPVVNALVAMYMKCGNLEIGRHIFRKMGSRRDVVSWNSMISGLGIHGLGIEAVEVFQNMIEMGLKPSSVSFVSVLAACSHAGLVEEGRELFNSMTATHGVTASSEHYACVVDLLGRAGKLDEAAKLVADMRIEPGPTVWGSLLGACKIHGNVEFAERACARLFELEPMNAGNYVLLASIYASAEMWEEMNMVKRLLKTQGLQKMPGCSWIEVKRRVYSFMSVDETNLQTEQLNALLVQIVNEMKKIGYIPQTQVVLYDLEQEEKERILLGHSEKLAVAFGLINANKKDVIRVTKNLRLCEDCHSVTKFISKFANREIMVRDVNRFHHFREGVCSCGDYW